MAPTLIKYHRYNANMTYGGIFEQYASRYNIPVQYQMIFKVNDDNKPPTDHVNIKEELSISQSLENTKCKVGTIFDEGML